MSRKYKGIRALGNVSPEVRSALIGLSRSVRSLSQAQRTMPLPNEIDAARAPGVVQQRGPSAGGRSTHVLFGRDADRPNAGLLLTRGAGALMYVANDTGKVYIWDGVRYKSSTFT